jgi:hypothetical protein
VRILGWQEELEAQTSYFAASPNKVTLSANTGITS